MAKLIGELGPLEAEIMDHAWTRDEPVTVREVVDSVGVRHDLAYTTVMTVMERLSTKGFLVRRKVGRAYSYKTRLSRDDYWPPSFVRCSPHPRTAGASSSGSSGA